MPSTPNRAWPLLLALPSLVVYAVVHLAVWPAQMSPDSIDQWGQMTSWQWDDIHPVSATLINYVAFLVYPSPAAVAIAQYVALSLVTGLLFSETINWGVRPVFAVIAALLFPLFLPNALIVTTLWKDVPFGICVLLLTGLTLSAIRQRWSIGRWHWAAMIAAGVVMVAVRHNGIIATALFFAIVALAVRPARLPASVGLAVQLVAFAATKTVLLALLNAQPQPAELRAIVTLPFLGAALEQNLIDDPADRQMLLDIAPLDAWTAIPCGNAVPFYFREPRLDRAKLALHASEMFGLALRTAMAHRRAFLEQELCMTGLFWRPWNNPGERLRIAPLGISALPQNAALGLAEASRLPALRTWIAAVHKSVFVNSTVYNRPATLLIAAAALLAAIGWLIHRGLWVLALPAALNVVSLAALIQSQEYRFVWPSVAAGLFIILFALGLLASGRFGRRAAAAGEIAVGDRRGLVAPAQSP
ncbi:MAG: hypothetical protein Q7T08_01625 [Devosia sp.]|nr:hypothetical protein [Devosia sp.]